MSLSFIKPDFGRNIVNITATLAECLGCPTGKPVLPLLAKELQKGYKNVVFLILDGLGVHPMEVNLPKESFFRRNMREKLTTVFPSTTACATTSFLTGKYPMEHGWLGWSLYFEEIGKSVDLFHNAESSTHIPIGTGFVKGKLPAVAFYKYSKEYRAIAVVPAYWDGDDENRYIWEDFDGMLLHIENICAMAGKQFIYAYFDEPDATMHRFGVTSTEAKTLIEKLEGGLEALFGRLKDTLLVISADHGQTDIGENIELYRDEELLSMLLWPPYLDSRATAFRIKEGQTEKFTAYFGEKYGRDFELFRSEELVRQNFFGGNFVGEHAALLGDFIAVAASDKVMLHHALSHHFRGHHASLTEDEMLVPLIYVGKGSF